MEQKLKPKVSTNLEAMELIAFRAHCRRIQGRPTPAARIRLLILKDIEEGRKEQKDP